MTDLFDIARDLSPLFVSVAVFILLMVAFGLVFIDGWGQH